MGNPQPISIYDPFGSTGSLGRILSVASFGALPNGNECGAQIIAAAAALQSAGGGVLLFPPGDYRVYSVGTVYSNLITLSGLAGVSIMGYGARLVIDPARIFTAPVGTMVQLSGCDNWNVEGLSAVGTLTLADMASSTVKGVSFLTQTAAQSTNGTFRNHTSVGMTAAYLCTDTIGAGLTRNVTLENISATLSFYGANPQNGPQNLIIRNLRTDRCKRSLIVYGVTGLRAHVDSADPQGDDVVVGAYADVNDFEIDYVRTRDTGAAGASAGGVVLWFENGSGGVSLRNGVISVRAVYPGLGTTPGLATILFRKTNNIANGSEFKNITFRNISIKNRPAYGGFGNIGADASFLWPAGDVWENIVFENVEIDDPGGFNRIFCGPLAGPLTLKNVKSNSELGFVQSLAANTPPQSGSYRIEDSSFPNLYVASGGFPALKNFSIAPFGGGTFAIPIGWRGQTITNAGMGAVAAQATLPNSGLGNVGAEFTFMRIDAGVFDIASNAGTDIIGAGLAGQKYRPPLHGSVTLKLVSAGQWDIVSSYGAETYV